MPLNSISIDIHDDTDAYLVSDNLLELGALSVTTTDLHRGTRKSNPLFVDLLNRLLSILPTRTAQPRHHPDNPKSGIAHASRRKSPFFRAIELLVMPIASAFNPSQTPTLKIYTDFFDEKRRSTRSV